VESTRSLDASLLPRPRKERSDGGWFANVVQSCLFALIHDELEMAPFLITMALLIGVLRLRTQSIAAGTLLHALNNLLALSALSS
jgi:membrane protease YdiL (CAAX protease family)